MDNKTRTISFKTLGCRLNQYETDALVSRFHNGGYQIVNFGEKADITVINTCTVTNQSDQKSRNYISQASHLNPGGVLVVAGCMANHRKEILEKQKNISYVIENEYKNGIFDLVDAHFSGEIFDPASAKPDVFGYETVQKSLHTRTSIKVQDGCDNFCSFCIIPRVRGRATSRPLNDILENVKRVINNGFKEIVITGVNIGRYDYEGLNFEKMLEKVLEIPGDFRIRISSLEPDGLSDHFHELFSHPKMCPHLHLCLQSGSDRILLQMRRMYTVSSFMQVVEKFRNRFPLFNFTTDIIVGFPGENDEDFHRTMEIAKEAAFTHIHTFRYSDRTGTRASRMPEHIPQTITANRSETVRLISEENLYEYQNLMIGESQEVLIEKTDEQGFASGYGQHYLPLRFYSPEASKNTFEKLTISKTMFQ